MRIPRSGADDPASSSLCPSDEGQTKENRTDAPYLATDAGRTNYLFCAGGSHGKVAGLVRGLYSAYRESLPMQPG